MIDVTAPSNIALIKYMGKTDSSQNRPANGSLSFTLDHLVTRILLTKNPPFSSDVVDTIQALREGPFHLELSEKGSARFLSFFRSLKAEFGLKGTYAIRSGNNFPSDCGLASSASSFAALTKAAYEMAKSEDVVQEMTPMELSKISQKGSGSSCRSFFSPFAIWKDEGAEPIDLGIEGLLHSVLILEDQKKQVSSSEAHRRVTTSILFQGRVERANQRMEQLINSLRKKDWKTSYEICWQEFWDMHSLFETSAEPFGYMTGPCMAALEILKEEWKRSGDGPLITMDAGPNIHLLFREDQRDLRTSLLEKVHSHIPEMKVMS